MIAVPLNDGGHGLDPRFNRARELYAKVKAGWAPVFDLVGHILDRWPENSPQKRAEVRAELLNLVNETPSLMRFIWIECPHLPQELRTEIERRLP